MFSKIFWLKMLGFKIAIDEIDILKDEKNQNPSIAKNERRILNV